MEGSGNSRRCGLLHGYRNFPAFNDAPHSDTMNTLGNHKRACFMVHLISRLLPTLLLAGAFAASPALAEEFPAITIPCNDVTLKFTRPGRIAQIPLKENAPVKKGQMLAHLDDSEETKA